LNVTLTLREDKRREAMRRVQAEALELFETRGFDSVTIEQIAAAARVSPPTVYRHFGTKERIVLWDEYDPPLFAAIAERLPERPVLNAIGDALVVALDKIYSEDATRILRRVRMVRSEPALSAANVAVLSEMKRGLAQVLAHSCADELEADVTAGAVVAALEAAVEHWARRNGKTPLRTLLRSAFRRLRKLGVTAAAESRE
jgi:AcrR family transcriptional regulator